MKIDNVKCVLCGMECEHGRSALSNSDTYNCPGCGTFNIGFNANFWKLGDDEDGAIKQKIAGYFYETKDKRGADAYYLTAESINKILADPIIPKTTTQKMEKLLLYLYKQNEYVGYEHNVNSATPPAIAYAKNEAELVGLCKAMRDTGWIENYKPDVVGNHWFTLAYKGISHAEQIINATTSAKADIKYDVFICHASEDKEAFVDPFNAELESKGITAFYDKISIAWGESVVRKINEGLAHSKVGVIVISDDFMKKEWPNTEIDTLINLMINDKKRLLPILHNISYESMAQKYPLIASLSCRDSSKKTISEMVSEISIILNYLD